jgi:hypothetical protein
MLLKITHNRFQIVQNLPPDRSFEDQTPDAGKTWQNNPDSDFKPIVDQCVGHHFSTAGH